MSQVNSKKIALASGITAAIIYTSCSLFMTILPKGTLVKLANIIFHGVDFSSNIRMNIPLSETLLGIVISFILWGIMGLIFSTIYNKVQ